MKVKVDVVQHLKKIPARIRRASTVPRSQECPHKGIRRTISICWGGTPDQCYLDRS